jgi:hypothetical protein
MNTPIYKSRRSGKNLWQEYRIYPDRVELQSWLLFHTITIPARDIDKIEVRPPAIGPRGLYPEGVTWGIKLDNADFSRHVLVTRKTGLWKRLAFTPDDPGKFVAACETLPH